MIESFRLLNRLIVFTDYGIKKFFNRCFMCTGEKNASQAQIQSRSSRVGVTLAYLIFVLFAPLSLHANGRLVDLVLLPQDFDLAIVAQDVIHNGHSMEIVQFSSYWEVNEIIEYFSDLWGNNISLDSGSDQEIPAFFINTEGPWKIIGTIHGNRQIVVQVQSEYRMGDGVATNNQLLTDSGAISSKRSLGFLSIMDITPTFNLPRPLEQTFSNGLLLSTTHSNDSRADTAFGGYESTLSTVLLDGSVRQVKSNFTSSYKRSGWSVQTTHGDRSLASMIMSRRGETAEVSFIKYDSNSVLVTINRVLR